MLTFNESLHGSPLPDDVANALSRARPFSGRPLDSICFFDIETTGLSADVSSVYLIGCAYVDDDGLRLRQWFADDYVSERDMLLAFLDFLSNYDLLVHYNGSHFDVPYLCTKCEQHGLDASPLHGNQFDLYSHFRPYKRLLPLSSLRQKAVEDLLAVKREDAMDGGALTYVYSEYMKCKFFRSPAMNQNLRLLLLHNKEDVWGLVRILPLALTLQNLHEAPSIDNVDLSNQALALTGSHPYPPPFPITLASHKKTRGVSLAWDASGHFSMAVPVHQGELKYFYQNYKDYYYLPLEDAVIHKSVASYVEPKYREKVGKKDCYVTKMGRYLPAYYNPCRLREFRQSYSDKAAYVELTDELLMDAAFWSRYAAAIVNFILG